MIYLIIINLFKEYISVLSRENDLDGVIDTTFEVEYDWFGKVLQRELMAGGKDIPVTNSNKEEYVR